MASGHPKGPHCLRLHYNRVVRHYEVEHSPRPAVSKTTTPLSIRSNHSCRTANQGSTTRVGKINTNSTQTGRRCARRLRRLRCTTRAVHDSANLPRKRTDHSPGAVLALVRVRHPRAGSYHTHYLSHGTDRLPPWPRQQEATKPKAVTLHGACCSATGATNRHSRPPNPGR